MKELIKEVSDRYGANLTFEKEHDAYWKFDREIAVLTGFKDYLDKLNCQHDIEDKFRELKLDYTLIGQYHPELFKITWRTTDGNLP